MHPEDLFEVQPQPIKLGDTYVRVKYGKRTIQIGITVSEVQEPKQFPFLKHHLSLYMVCDSFRRVEDRFFGDILFEYPLEMLDVLRLCRNLNLHFGIAF